MARDLHLIYESMVNEMCAMAADSALLDSCMTMNQEAIRHVPLRYRIIALGFVNGFTLDQLNDKLNAQGCPKLYSRSFWEATLIFAFSHGYSYAQWREIEAQCADIYGSVGDPEWFREKKITYEELERYVAQNSDARGDLMATRMQTRRLEEALLGVDDQIAALRRFLILNAEAFSTVREKTRYYFCKYMLYYINRRIENYFEACRRGRGVDEALSELLCLKVVTKLRRSPNMPETEKRALIRTSSVSCGEIFDAFNYFFFGYVSMDWAEALMECYERIEDIPEAHKRRLAAVFRKGRSDLKGIDDEEVIRRRVDEIERSENEAYAKDGNRGYGRNRNGETAVNRFIRGPRDIDRSLLLCFLLFFASDAQMPEAHRLTVDRVQTILRQCGYPAIDMENDFDWFVVEFLESRRPVDFLMEVVTEFAMRYENSFLYHVYGNAVQYEQELAQVMLSGGQRGQPAAEKGR